MLDLFESRQLVGFVDGTILPPEKEHNKEDYLSWKKSNGEVRRLIFDMVTEEILESLAQVEHLETARDAWIAVEGMLSPSAPSLPEFITKPGAAPEFPTETNPTTQIIYGNSTEQDSAVKLCRTNYSEWRQQMLDLLESWQLVGYVDGTIQPPEEAQNQEEYWLWKTSDGQVRELIFNMVTVEILEPLAEVTLATAREAWIALEEMLSPSAPSLPQSIHGPEIEHKKLEDKKATVIAKRYSLLYRATLNGDWENATKFFEQEPNAVRDAITVFSETALMLAVRSSKRNHFAKKLMETISPEDVVRSDYVGKTALHHATENHNNVAAKLLVEKNPELLYILDEAGETPRELAVHYAALRGNRELVDYLLDVTKLDGDPNPFEGNLGVGLLTNLICGELYALPKVSIYESQSVNGAKLSPYFIP